MECHVGGKVKHISREADLNDLPLLSLFVIMVSCAPSPVLHSPSMWRVAFTIIPFVSQLPGGSDWCKQSSFLFLLCTLVQPCGGYCFRPWPCVYFCMRVQNNSKTTVCIITKLYSVNDMVTISGWLNFGTSSAKIGGLMAEETCAALINCKSCFFSVAAKIAKWKQDPQKKNPNIMVIGISLAFFAGTMQYIFTS